MFYANPVAEFIFGKGIRVYHPLPRQPLVERSAAILHEVSHLVLASGSSFGLFQSAVARLSDAETLPNPWRSKCKETLNSTLQASREVYECCSVGLEVLMAANHSFNKHKYKVAGLTDEDDERKTMLFTFLEGTKLDAWVLKEVTDTVATVALCTPVLRDLSRIAPYDVKAIVQYLRGEYKKPDQRLKWVLQDIPLSHEIGRAVLRGIYSRHGRVSSRKYMWNMRLNRSREAKDLENAAIKRDVLEVLLILLPFEIVPPAEFLKDFNALIKNWRSLLPFPGFAFPAMRSLFPSRKRDVQPEDFACDRLDFCPAPNRQMALCLADEVPSASSESFWRSQRDSGNLFYLHVRNVEPTGYDLHSQASRAGDVALYLRTVSVEDGSRVFRNPLSAHTAVGRITPCFLSLNNDGLSNTVSRGLPCPCVMSTVERTFNQRLRNAHLRRFLNSAKPPLIVFPESSTLLHWESVVSACRREGDCYALYTRQLSANNDVLDCCFIIPWHGRFAFVRPTVLQVFERLMQKNHEVRRIVTMRAARELFSGGWWDRALLACEHYYYFGY